MLVSTKAYKHKLKLMKHTIARQNTKLAQQRTQINTLKHLVGSINCYVPEQDINEERADITKNVQAQKLDALTTLQNHFNGS
tara:strand:- start:276 stop:521 length:246 start_codon:yes stop_codon:yes gene_type:complete